MKAIIIAGGKGTRISSVRSDVPKPMIEVCGKPVLQHIVERLREQGVTDITLVVGHLGKVVKDYFGNGRNFGVAIDYFEEETPLGTGGALFQMPLPSDDFVITSGDIIFDIDFSRFVSFHKSHDALATLAAHPNGHPFDSALLVTETLAPKKGGLPIETKRIVKWLSKDEPRLYYKNRVNAGIEIVSPALIEFAKTKWAQRCENDARNISDGCRVDLDKDILKVGIATGKVFAYDTSEYIKDMGTPERWREVAADIESGKVLSRNLSHKQRAIFLDRDGTLNVDKGLINSPDDFVLLPGAAEAVKKINNSGFLAILVTNQSVIARGDCDFETLDKIHDKMETLLGNEGAFLDGIYFCPHHPDKGFAGEQPEYKRACDCRKPAPGLLLKAARDFNIDLSRSYMVGDNARDVEAGKNAGCKKSVLLKDGYSLLDFVNEYVETD